MHVYSIVPLNRGGVALVKPGLQSIMHFPSKTISSAQALVSALSAVAPPFRPSAGLGRAGSSHDTLSHVKPSSGWYVRSLVQRKFFSAGRAPVQPGLHLATIGSARVSAQVFCPFQLLDFCIWVGVSPGTASGTRGHWTGLHCRSDAWWSKWPFFWHLISREMSDSGDVFSPSL